MNFYLLLRKDSIAKIANDHKACSIFRFFVQERKIYLSFFEFIKKEETNLENVIIEYKDQKLQTKFIEKLEKGTCY